MGVTSLILLSDSIDSFEARTGRSPRLRTTLIENLL
jgi:hypothetical protein